MNWIFSTTIQVVAIIVWWEILGKIMKRIRKRFKIPPFCIVGFEKVGDERVIWTWTMK